MRASAVALASLVLAGSSVAAFDVCPDGAADVLTPHPCCTTTASSRRRRLFSRNDVCSDGNPPCCIAKASGPPVVRTGGTTDLQCGHDFGNDPEDVPSGVTFTIEPCPASLYPDQTCFHIHLTAAPGQTIQPGIHLGILDDSVNPNTLPNGLGNWPQNGFCLPPSGNVGDCWVPLSVVVGLLVPSSPDLCDQHINVAVGFSISDATCFAKGTVIDEQGRWFMYTQVGFTCPDVCTQSCCCPSIPPPTHSCDIGTAFGYNGQAINFNGNPVGPALTPNNCKARWGWYFKVSSGDLSTTGLTGELIVGAGGNDVGKGTPVGTFTAKLTGTTLTVTYSLSSEFDLSEVHVYAACVAPGSCAPGSYGNPATQPDLSGTTDTSFHTDINVPSCANYYLIFHAKVNQLFPSDTPCPTPVT